MIGISEQDRQADGAEDVALELAVEFFCTVILDIRDLQAAGGADFCGKTVDETGVEIGDDGAFVDGGAVLPGVAVEEDVAGDGADFAAAEKVEARRGDGGFVAAAGADEVGAEILRQAPADAGAEAAGDVGADVSEREAVASEEVGGKIRRGPEVEAEQAVAAFPAEDEAGFVVELVIPAVGVGDADDVVKTVLRLSAECGAADHAEGEFEGAEGFAVERFGLEVDRGVEPAGVGAVVGVGRDEIGVSRGVDVLSEGDAGFVVEARGVVTERGDVARDVADEVGRFVEAGGAEEGELEAVGVVAVGAGEVFVVLGDEGEGAGAKEIFVAGLRFLGSGRVGGESGGGG